MSFAVIVPVFQPSLEDLRFFEEIAVAIPVYLVDDSPVSHENLVFVGSCGVTIIESLGNCGIARALNRGILAAGEDGVLHVVTVDQDSRPSVEMLQGLVAKLGQAEYGIVGPAVIAGRLDKWVRISRQPGDVVRVPVLIQSCMTFSVATWRALGGFREEFFIDGVDTEFCLKASRAGIAVGAWREAELDHKLGDGVDSRSWSFAGKRFVATNHSAMRRYYVNKNAVSLIFEYARDDWRWAIDFVARLTVFNCASLTEQGGLVKLMASIRGLFHGFAGLVSWRATSHG